MPEERFSIEFGLTLPDWGTGVQDKVLSVILVLAVVGALGTLSYVIASPGVGQRFSEFYILGLEGKAADYPEALAVGKEGRVTVGIVNHEYRTMSYRVEVRIEGVKNNEVRSIVLGPDENWEGEVSFVPGVSGENQKLEFLLYREGEVTPSFEPLRLSLDVKE